jgi:tripartite-type tricarboxylate transporter receptor subunit TctC
MNKSLKNTLVIRFNNYIRIGILSLCITLHLYATYPNKNIRVIVHVPPGGGTDSMARMILQYVGKTLDINFIVENYRGAGGQVGYTTLAMAEPDGYTIGTITTTSIITHELTRTNVLYRMKESFIPIARIVMDPSGLFVKYDSPFNTFDEVLNYAKENPDMLSCGGSSLWGAHHVHCVMLKQTCGVVLNYIPFDGGAESRNNLLGGHIDVAAGGISEFESLILSGKVRALVIASSNRVNNFPEVPTYKELGYNLIIGSDRGFAVPAGTPVEYVKLLSETIKKTLKNPDFLKNAQKIRIASTLDYLNSENFYKYLLDMSYIMNELINKSKE